MRRIGGVFDELASLDNLWAAWRTFRRGKRRRATVARFQLDADRQLPRLHRALLSGGYHPGPYRLGLVVEPKVRLISAAPVRDRVVHHALHRVLAPRVDRSLIHNTYACIEGRGTHRALLSALGALRKHPWVIALDVRRFFLAIDHDVLRSLLERQFKDRRALALMDRIITSGDGLYARADVRAALSLPDGFPGPGRGLPLGSLTSQWWANHYLSPLDHFITRELRPRHYQRYADDLLLFDRDPEALLDAAHRIADAARETLHLDVALKAPPRSCHQPLTHLGYRIHRTEGVRVSRAKLDRACRRLGRLAQRGSPERLERALASYRGWVRFF